MSDYITTKRAIDTIEKQTANLMVDICNLSDEPDPVKRNELRKAVLPRYLDIQVAVKSLRLHSIDLLD